MDDSRSNHRALGFNADLWTIYFARTWGRFWPAAGTDESGRDPPPRGPSEVTEKVISDRVFGGVVSENGPREGTRDLPRPGPDAGHRAVDEDSAAGVAYRSLSRSLRRRREELVALAEASGTASVVAKSYQTKHPLEPVVTAAEVDAAIAEAKTRAARVSSGIVDGGRPRGRNSDARV